MAKKQSAWKTEKGKPNKARAGQPVDYFTAPHPKRKNSPEYDVTRKWLMGQTGAGCYVCGGPVDLSHDVPPADAKKLHLEDHHGGGIFHGTVLVGFNLFPLEWAAGWAADPKKVALFVKQLDDAGLCDYKDPINTVEDVMKWVDSRFNANVKLCRPHHVGMQDKHTPDINGHEAVGIHNAPWPVLAAQATCDWDNFDMFAGTTGLIAVAPDPKKKGGVVVTYQHPIEPRKAHFAAAYMAVGKKPPERPPFYQIGDQLGPDHPLAIAAQRGYKGRAPIVEAMRQMGVRVWNADQASHRFKGKISA